MRRLIALLGSVVASAALGSILAAQDAVAVSEFDADELEDKIRGGMLGQVIGNMNGLPHEFKYIDDPGNIAAYTPALPDGARTDDDTDLEWVYLREIARTKQPILPPGVIVRLWKSHINRGIWCANEYARQLMVIGVEPPWTGSPVLNPWSDFNISGQFVCESFGLLAPAMPQTAARIGLNYTRVTIDGEPAQATQLFTTMIATAFVEANVNRLLNAGVSAVDPRSKTASIVQQVRQLHRQNPDDWRATRLAIKQRWQKHGGAIRDRNGYELNTASTIASLLHGKGDFAETLRIAFNLGWDCDNNAATAATILGVIHGRRWMKKQNWDIADRYQNTTRDAMPAEETLTSFENTLVDCARIAIAVQGGGYSEEQGRRFYQVRVEAPANVEPLPTDAELVSYARQHWSPKLAFDLSATGQRAARSAYIAICLGENERLKDENPEAWAAAVKGLRKHPDLLRVLFSASAPGDRLRRAAQQAGLERPAR